STVAWWIRSSRRDARDHDPATHGRHDVKAISGSARSTGGVAAPDQCALRTSPLGTRATAESLGSGERESQSDPGVWYTPRLSWYTVAFAARPCTRKMLSPAYAGGSRRANALQPSLPDTGARAARPGARYIERSVE